MTRRVWNSASIMAMLIASPGTAMAADAMRAYSNVCYNEEAGDMVGDQIVILELNPEDTVILFSEAEGSLGAPTLVTLTPDQGKEIRAGKLNVEAAINGPDVRPVRGTISAKEIVLTEGGIDNYVENGKKSPPEHLKRVSLPLRYPVCK